MSYDVSMPAEKLHDLECRLSGRDSLDVVNFFTQPDRTLATDLDRPMPGSTIALILTVAQIRVAAAWAEAGETMCPVEFGAGPDGVTVAQGEVRTVITTDGSLSKTSTTADTTDTSRPNTSEVAIERDYLLDRMKAAASPQASETVGASSQSMVINAIDPSWPLVYPDDINDLNRCERTFDQAPEHLLPRMRPVLDKFRRRVLRQHLAILHRPSAR